MATACNGRLSTIGPVVYGMVHEGAHDRICFNWNAGTVRRNSGTSFDLALAAVGADDAPNHWTVIVLSLSVNETLDFVVVRDQPSGTFTVNPPFVERYGRNRVESGMSPGGLLSTGTGDSWGAGLCPPPCLGVWPWPPPAGEGSGGTSVGEDEQAAAPMANAMQAMVSERFMRNSWIGAFCITGSIGDRVQRGRCSPHPNRFDTGPQHSACRPRITLMSQGTIKEFDPSSRTGVLLQDDRSEVHIDRFSLEGSGLRYLRIGQRVKYDLAEEGGRKLARGLRHITF